MLTEDGKHLYVSYDEYHNLIEKLALKIHHSGWQFDNILCLARGGMRPGDILSRIFDKPLAIMSTSSYRAEAGTVQGHLDLARYITTPKGEIAGRVLLVDDLADSGHTLKAVVDCSSTITHRSPNSRPRSFGPKVCQVLSPITAPSTCQRTLGFISPLRAMTAHAQSS